MNFKGQRNKQKQNFVSDRSNDIIGSNVIKISDDTLPLDGVDNSFRNSPKYMIKIKWDKIVTIFKSTSFINFTFYQTPQNCMGWETQILKNRLKPISVEKRRCLVQPLQSAAIASRSTACPSKQTADQLVV